MWGDAAVSPIVEHAVSKISNMHGDAKKNRPSLPGLITICATELVHDLHLALQACSESRAHRGLREKINKPVMMRRKLLLLRRRH
jgi:hypothetical protein